MNKVKLSRKIALIVCHLFLSAVCFAQSENTVEAQLEGLDNHNQHLGNEIKNLQKFKTSGYIQTQYQYGEKDASLKVGTANTTDKPFNRMGIRRGRMKFTYEDGPASGVFQLDITEKGVELNDAFLALKESLFKSQSLLKAGFFDRPFGNEISYSSAQLESPERALLIQTLFPEERDLGAMLQLQAPKSSKWSLIKLEAGLFAGNGIKQETDNRKDFIGHLSVSKTFGNSLKLSGGTSYYHGSVYQGTENVYRTVGKKFVRNQNTENIGKFAKREYIGFDIQLEAINIVGASQIRAEYLFGQQPGTKTNSKSPNASTLPTHDTYIRNFSGWYAIFIQDVGTLPISAVIKYDMYNPNTKISGNDIGLHESSSGDIAYNTLGFGLLWTIHKNVRLQAFYEFVANEKSENLNGYSENRKDNVFTLRLQYKY